MTSAAHNANGDRADQGLPPVPSIPLSEEPPGGSSSTGERSIGSLVRDATAQLSTLLRAELELARIEVARDVKRGVRGSIFFIIALTVLLFSLFFFFFALAELLADIGLYRSAAFGIVFGAMLVVVGLAAFLGYRRVRGIKGPRRTISTVRETASVLTSRGGSDPEAEQQPAAGNPQT